MVAAAVTLTFSYAHVNIAGNEYHILESSYLANSSIQRKLTIVNENLWGGKCNLLGNYSQFWWPGSLFQISDGYTNLTLWKHCNQIPENVHGNLSLCGDDWYYSLSPHLNPERRPFCNVSQLPIKNVSTQTINNKTLLGQGFEVIWHVDPDRYQSCGATIYDISIIKHNLEVSYKLLCFKSIFWRYCLDNVEMKSFQTLLK
jgi:hypothetical protein